MAKTPKRPEISAKEFAAALGIAPTLVIEFDSETFGLASNNGQMIEEFAAKSKAAQQFRDLALTLTHRKDQREEKRPSPLAPLAPLLEKLKLKR
jgi:pilus assembly protein CpaE